MAKPLIGTKGEGTVFYSEKRDRWVVKVPVGQYSSGKTKYVSRDVTTRSEAMSLRRQLLTKRDNRQLATGPRQTFQDYAMYFLEFDAPTDCKTTTINDYYGHLNRYLFPIIGKRAIADITSVHLEQILTNLRKRYSAKTVNTIRGVLSSVFSSAERHGIVVFNPVKRTKPAKADPRDKSKKQPPWTLEEIHTVLNTRQGSFMHVWISFTLATGMRLGEVLGLKWSDIDFETGTLYVQRTLRITSDYKSDGLNQRLVFNTPKTPDSQRFLQIHSRTLAALSSMRIDQESSKAEMGDAWVDSGCIFANRNGGPMQPTTFRSRYKAFLKENNIRYITPHDIRHTFAVRLIENGASLQQVQQALGHSSIEITKDTYAHNLPVLAQQATELQANLMYPETLTALPRGRNSFVITANVS
jgi:integrase